MICCLCDEHLQGLVLRIYPFAVPDKIFGLALFLDFIDRGTRCACASSATGSTQARDPTSYARRLSNPETIAPILPQQIKKTATRKRDVLNGENENRIG